MNNKRAKSFVTIMIIIATLALMLRFLIERLITLNIAQNESRASVTLKMISQALENYAEDKGDIYPPDFSLLTASQPPYLDKNYIVISPVRGYSYACPRLEPAGYSCYASPVKCGLSGNMVYTISTGSVLVSEECEARE